MASRGINKVIVVGNCGRDPEVRYTPNGSAVANLTVATSEQWKDKTTGESQERTEWHRIVFFNRLAEIVAEYVKKGQQVYVEGKLQTRKWQDQSGADRYSTEIVADQMQMLGGRPSGGGGGGDQFDQSQPQNQGGGYNQSKPQSQPRQQQNNNGGQQANNRPASQPAPATPSAYDDFDDDIPF